MMTIVLWRTIIFGFGSSSFLESVASRCSCLGIHQPGGWLSSSSAARAGSKARIVAAIVSTSKNVALAVLFAPSATRIRREDEQTCRHYKSDRKGNHVTDCDLHSAPHPFAQATKQPRRQSGSGVRNSSKKPFLPLMPSSKNPTAMNPQMRIIAFIFGSPASLPSSE